MTIRDSRTVMVSNANPKHPVAEVANSRLVFGHRGSFVPLVTALLFLVIASLYMNRFRDQDYIPDEVNTVHAGQVLTVPETAQWMATNATHPAGWRVLAVTWVKLTGVTEPVVRYFSILCSLLSLALLFRLGADLFDHAAGWYAIFILGTTPFAIYFMVVFRPYALLITISTALLLTFLRWLNRPNFVHALLFVMCGAAGLQTHYYAGFMLVGLALTFVILVQWDRALYLRAAGLFAAIGLSLTAWALPLIYRLAFGRQGVSYARASNLDTLRQMSKTMQISPESLGYVLLLSSLLLPVAGARFRLTGGSSKVAVNWRFGAEWRKLYVLLPPFLAMAVAMLSNVRVESVTPRNLTIILPPLAIACAYALRRLPWQTGLVFVLLIAGYATNNFRTYLPSPPYKETVSLMSQTYQPGDGVVLHNTISFALRYYLLDRLPGITRADILRLGQSFPVRLADPEVNEISTSDPSALAQFDTFLGDTSQVWFLHGELQALALPYLEAIEEHFALAQSERVLGDKTGWIVQRYRRIPDDAADHYHFGKNEVSWQAVYVPGGMTAHPCQQVTIETWWQAMTKPEGSYGIGLVLADETGTERTIINMVPSSAPTSTWEPGLFYFDTRTLSIPCDLTGEYLLLIGLYDAQTGDPLVVTMPDGTRNESNLVYMTTLLVTE